MDEREQQRRLRRSMTEGEQAYYAAYPPVRAPFVGAVMAALVRGWRGVLVAALAACVLAALFWVAYAYWWAPAG
ncbi:MAG: hypothetical protein K6T31_09645 [Alicyclobacillus sp.]|nr:hypothetical protein [Alicyclobacillus sp.]